MGKTAEIMVERMMERMVERRTGKEVGDSGFWVGLCVVLDRGSEGVPTSLPSTHTQTLSILSRDCFRGMFSGGCTC